ncbi:hypothetical protein AV530_011693 [Patagioenas fasciata monilis]|uniref:Uncharacterized protein n=1 Tax=Patagioenas fasciata monilis TaxID=372326 RepID=A0A1V4KLA4_PATFA|nr:hypothetical protein AV530_011693 [Patagioenas fasciata monilis]
MLHETVLQDYQPGLQRDQISSACLHCSVLQDCKEDLGCMTWRRPGASNHDTLSLVVPDVMSEAGKPQEW